MCTSSCLLCRVWALSHKQNVCIHDHLFYIHTLHTCIYTYVHGSSKSIHSCAHTHTHTCTWVYPKTMVCDMYEHARTGISHIICTLEKFHTTACQNKYLSEFHLKNPYLLQGCQSQRRAVVCMYVCMYICMYVYMYVCMCLRLFIFLRGKNCTKSKWITCIPPFLVVWYIY